MRALRNKMKQMWTDMRQSHNMNAQGLDAQGKEDQMAKSDGGATSPLQHVVMRRSSLIKKLETQRKSFLNIMQSFDCSKCKSLATRIIKLDREIDQLKMSA